MLAQTKESHLRSPFKTRILPIYEISGLIKDYYKNQEPILSNLCQESLLAQTPEFLSSHNPNSELNHQSCVAGSASLKLSSTDVLCY